MNVFNIITFFLQTYVWDNKGYHATDKKKLWITINVVCCVGRIEIQIEFGGNDSRKKQEKRLIFVASLAVAIIVVV